MMSADDSVGYAILQREVTLRDQFAMAAMEGLISQSKGTAYDSSKSDGARWAYEIADAMLAERERAK